MEKLNTIFWKHLLEQGDTHLPPDERRAIFVAGDDAEAKRVVTGLVEELGFAAVDTGTLAGSAVQEPGAAIYNKELTAAEARARLEEGG